MNLSLNDYTAELSKNYIKKSQKTGEIISDSKPRMYMFFMLSLLLLVLSYFILRSFLLIILNSLVFVILFSPVYNGIKKVLRSKVISSAVATFLVILVILVPVVFLFGETINESATLYAKLSPKLKDIDLFQKDCDTYLCKLNTQVSAMLESSGQKLNLMNAATELGKKTYLFVFNSLMKIPSMIFNFFIMVFLIFFMFIEKDKIMEYILKAIPFDERHKHKFVEHIRDTMYAVVFGQIVVAIIEGILGGLGLYLFGVPSPVLLGIVIAVLAILPMVGASLVWIPASLYLIINGIIDSQHMMILNGILLALYSFVIINFVDLILKPKIIGDRASMHPVLIFLGILGGLEVFGFSGLVLGPAILCISVKMIEFYEEEKQMW